MKRIFCYMGVIAVLFFGACDSNKKLRQDNAEKAIKAFFSAHSVSPIPGTAGLCSFNAQSITSIEPLRQFSETEATSVVLLQCSKASLPFEFLFQKDIDNQWFLTKIGAVKGLSSNKEFVESISAPYQNLKVPAR